MRILCIIVALFALLSGAFGQTPRSIEGRILQHLLSLEKWSSFGGSGDYDKLEKENAVLRAELLRFGKVPATLSYEFPRLKDKMFITTSLDGRLRIYSWDMETGGSMHDFDAVYQYRGKSGYVRTWAEHRNGDFGAGVFYHDIFEVDTASGRVYLPVSTFIGSTSLNGQRIAAVKIRGESLIKNVKIFRTFEGPTNSIGFEYDFFSVVDRPERPVKLFEYDRLKKALRFPVVIEDKESPQGRVTDKFITYRFNGTYFVKEK